MKRQNAGIISISFLKSMAVSRGRVGGGVLKPLKLLSLTSKKLGFINDVHLRCVL